MKSLAVIGFFLWIHSGYSQFVSYGAIWKYFDLAMAPPDQSGMNWKQLAYNDSGWSSGPAELGYGDGDESTVISSSTLTAYYRYAFSVQDTGAYDSLSLLLTYDDGAVVYLNGNEVWRVNMPSGTITYNTFASTTSADNAQATVKISSPLLPGQNILAVEIHQRSASSSDLSFNFSLFGLPAPGVAVIVRGPYLQKATDHSMVIRYRTNLATPSIVDYGLSQNALIHTKSDTLPKTEHILTIDSLAPVTKYFYRIRNATDTLLYSSPTIYFKTYPQPDTAAPLTAWILGDCGTGNNNARNVRNAFYSYIGNQHTDMMLFLGDNAYTDGTDAEYQTALFQNMYETKLRNTVAWSCLGNHDGHSANSGTQTGPYYDIFSFPTSAECGGTPSGTEAYYSFDYGYIHFIVLDSYETDRSVGGPMYTWCEDDLQNTLAYWIIALWHHPAYSKGSHNSDTETELKQMRENFLPLFEDYGVDLVLSGHSHSYERTYLLHGHYGLSSTFSISSHTVGVTGDGSGQPENDEAYYKAPTGPESGVGAVYITAGSSGKFQVAALDHPAMYYDAAVLGSCILKIKEDTLRLSFLRQTGAIDDHFTLIKDASCIPGSACNDDDSCTINDTVDNFCYCHGEMNHRYVSNTNNSGPGSLREAIQLACNGDTILFQSTVDDTIRLSTELDITKDLVLLAEDNQNIILSGQHQTRILYIASPAQVTLTRLTLFDGNESTDGGAFLNHGTIILEHTNLKHNWQGDLPKAWSNTGLVSIKTGTSFLRL